MGVLKIRNSANSAWLEVGGSVSFDPSMLADADGDTKIQTEESADEDIIRMDAAGVEIWRGESDAIIQPVQPWVHAEISVDWSNIGVGSIITVPFDTEVKDVGANFNTSTYTFTAPRDGAYQMSFMLYLLNIDTAAGYYLVGLNTSNRTYDLYFDPNYTADLLYKGHGASITVDMDENDTAYIRIYQSSGAAQTDMDDANTHFTVYFLG